MNDFAPEDEISNIELVAEVPEGITITGLEAENGSMVGSSYYFNNITVTYNGAVETSDIEFVISFTELVDINGQPIEGFRLNGTYYQTFTVRPPQ